MGTFRWFWITLLSPFAVELLLWLNVSVTNASAVLDTSGMTHWVAGQLEWFASSFISPLIGLCLSVCILVWLWRVEANEEAPPASKGKQIAGWLSVGLGAGVFGFSTLGYVLPAADEPRAISGASKQEFRASETRTHAAPTLAPTGFGRDDLSRYLRDTKPEHVPRLQEAIDLLKRSDGIDPVIMHVFDINSDIVSFTFGEVEDDRWVYRIDDSWTITIIINELLRDEQLPTLATLMLYELLLLDLEYTKEFWKTPQDCTREILDVFALVAEAWQAVGTSITSETPLARTFDTIYRKHANGTLRELDGVQSLLVLCKQFDVAGT